MSASNDDSQELVEADAMRTNRRRIDQALLEALMDDPATDMEWNEANKSAWRKEAERILGSKGADLQ